MQNSGKGLSITGLVLGIISSVLAWFYVVNIAAIVCGIVGIVCAAKGKKMAVAAGASTGLGTAGLVLAIIGTCIAGVGFLSCTVCVGCTAAGLSSLAA